MWSISSKKLPKIARSRRCLVVHLVANEQDIFPEIISEIFQKLFQKLFLEKIPEIISNIQFGPPIFQKKIPEIISSSELNHEFATSLRICWIGVIAIKVKELNGDLTEAKNDEETSQKDYERSRHERSIFMAAE